MSSRTRLLGLAFAAADVLFETANGDIVFAMGGGVVPQADPAQAWVGQSLESLVDLPDRSAVRDALAGLRPGGRSAALPVAILAPGGWSRRASLRFFALPELAPAVSCAILWCGPPVRASASPLLDAKGLLRRFTSALSGSGEQALAVEFVEVPGLGGTDAPHQRASATIRDRLQAASLDGSSAAALAPDRFALLTGAAEALDLAEVVRAAGQAEGLDLEAVTSRGQIAPGEAQVAVRTLRLALEDCLKDGAEAGSNFAERLKRTVQDADRFRAIVRDRDFSLVYQPIVSLETKQAHHFEALVRFGAATQAPTGAISMAEELGLMEAFDLAVAEKVLTELRRPGSSRSRVAVNASAASFAADGYVEGVLRMTQAAPELRRRLLVEITETAALSDLEAAGRRISALRSAGIQVCLDDFGVGATSFDYLRRLGFDVVKIDGAFIRDLSNPRTRTLALGLVELCRDLKVATVAEMIETESQAAAATALGVDFGQGWLYGRPGPSPIVLTSAPVAARRRGEIVGWG